ncbi:putative sporulation protein YtxC [Desulfotomaculum arcticum]|uniref:Putative sporulation protein YtxC n=1 Tax=Desulfotruncus arcticus DSM 17038 TaxID=1121424 RepID=A0A1I2ZBM9_9FIRM|nr:putative sporulation protein YtxC [Desulfotruncus arcticus]SFH35174.1 putative sporulation protein YtxC [Desulfotomaculum arcticum] [Desulfotruncus arcticus DSM 17038]
MPQQCISIGTASQQDLVKQELSRGLKSLQHEGLSVNLQEDQTNGFTFLDCCVSGHTEPIISHRVAGVITNLIVNNWQDILLKDIIRENYYYFDEDEKGAIYDYAQKKINLNDKIKERYRLVILHKLTEYLSANNNLVIDGFIRFRLKDYIDQLYDVADQAVDDFLMEREYKEFIELLRYFVEIQEPKADLVNVVLQNDGVFKLYDEKNQPINSDYLRDFMIDLVENEINYEDLLISALITIAPREVKFHSGTGEMPSSIVNTIKSVFVGRVSKCSGCSICKKHQ